MQRITAQQFLAADGVGDWRADDAEARTRYRIPSFMLGARFAVAIAELADAMGHHPDIDLRYGSIGIRVTTHDAGGLTERDVQLARQISAAARDAGLDVEPEDEA